MPFFSISFLFLFLPISIAFHFFAARLGERIRLCALIAISFLLFLLWDIHTGAVLAGSIVINFAIAHLLRQARDDEDVLQTNMFLVVGIAFNLVVLGAFRYAAFLIGSINSILNSDIGISKFLAPLSVLFFSCDQIAYLVDISRGKKHEADATRYAAFVSFFPRLIAGPLLRYEQIGTQWAKTDIDLEDLATGLATIAIGLAKIVLLAGAVAPFATAAFSAAASGEEIDLFAAWTGVLAFTCQIYFDLSGYTDVAIGVARCFGIKLPVNYCSPYCSPNVAEFWQRWNITLADFLRDYVYRPLGGNRGSTAHAAFNMIATMIVAGLWYGAGRMFVAWALLHSFFLFLHRIWRALASRSDTIADFQKTKTAHLLGIVVTFSAVTLAWIVFRVPDAAAGLNLLAGMSGQYGAVLPYQFAPFLPFAGELGIAFAPADGGPLLQAWLFIAICLTVIFAFPNTDALLSRFSAGHDERSSRVWPLQWLPSPFWAVAAGTIIFAVLASPDEANTLLHWRF